MDYEVVDDTYVATETRLFLGSFERIESPTALRKTPAEMIHVPRLVKKYI